MKGIILDLCGGTGAWSLPYKEAGFDVRVVTLPDWDLNWHYIAYGEIEFYEGYMKQKIMNIKMKDVYGILAAPPCTMFSLARTTAKEPRSLRLGMSLVEECVRIVWEITKEHNISFWAMENPKGLLRKFMGKPAFEFDASEFGCDYNKHTDLWGHFNQPKKECLYKRYDSTYKNTRKLPDIPGDYKIDDNMSGVAIKRSITPKGFAQAFYKANSNFKEPSSA